MSEMRGGNEDVHTHNLSEAVRNYAANELLMRVAIVCIFKKVGFILAAADLRAIG